MIACLKNTTATKNNNYVYWSDYSALSPDFCSPLSLKSANCFVTKEKNLPLQMFFNISSYQGLNFLLKVFVIDSTLNITVTITLKVKFCFKTNK